MPGGSFTTVPSEARKPAKTNRSPNGHQSSSFLAAARREGRLSPLVGFTAVVAAESSWVFSRAKTSANSKG